MISPMAQTTPMLAWMQSLADVTRARALRLLERHELTVAELCSVLQLPQSTVSRHLKLLADDGWIASRREGTSRFYQMIADDLEPPARRLWQLLREQTATDPETTSDDQRLAAVLNDRQTRSQQFFASSAGQWDRLRRELFGERFDLAALPALLDPAWSVADLGCGTGQLAESLAPFITHITAVDSSDAMLKSARARLKPHANVTVKKGELERLPIDDESLDAAVIYLVLHHIADPAKAIAEAARALKPNGKLLIVDMTSHDRREYTQQMGHVWLGFSDQQLNDWLDAALLTHTRITPLPADPTAKGPALFAATATRTNGKQKR